MSIRGLFFAAGVVCASAPVFAQEVQSFGAPLGGGHDELSTPAQEPDAALYTTYGLLPNDTPAPRASLRPRAFSLQFKTGGDRDETGKLSANSNLQFKAGAFPELFVGYRWDGSGLNLDTSAYGSTVYAGWAPGFASWKSQDGAMAVAASITASMKFATSDAAAGKLTIQFRDRVGGKSSPWLFSVVASANPSFLTGTVPPGASSSSSTQGLICGLRYDFDPKSLPEVYLSASAVAVGRGATASPFSDTTGIYGGELEGGFTWGMDKDHANTLFVTADLNHAPATGSTDFIAGVGFNY